MQSQLPTSNQDSNTGEQKRSVFDRLGRQLDTSRSTMNRRSPYLENLQPPPSQMTPMNESDFCPHYGRDPMQEMEWRYHNERRSMSFGRDRHHFVPPQPPPPHSPYDLDLAARQPQPPSYYPGPHPYHGNQPVPPMDLPMGMHQRRPSPKYDRHGNIIRGGPMRMEHMHTGISPPRNLLPFGSMLHPRPYDMRLAPMYPDQRWHETLDMRPLPHGHPGRLLHSDDQFVIPGDPRYQPLPQLPMPQQQTLLNDESNINQNSFGPFRYAKWRERRNVITSLDRETAQSSSRTDSLKSSLQQGSKGPSKNDADSKNAGRHCTGTIKNKDSVSHIPKDDVNTNNNPEKVSNKVEDKNSDLLIKRESQDISDGEIVDDEDSSDESISIKMDLSGKHNLPIHGSAGHQDATVRSRDNSLAYYESTKRRRMNDRDDCSMDYETISDGELSEFMSEKKDESKLIGDNQPNLGKKSSSEIELLNALGLDWANLVEMSKQSQSKKETTTACPALRRFSAPIYLPTLGISQNLAGPEIYDLMLRICH